MRVERALGWAFAIGSWWVLVGCLGPSPVVGEEQSELGRACLPPQEYEPQFRNFSVEEVNIDERSPECPTGVCLIDHFQGRVSCPYGQSGAAESTEKCFVPGSAGTEPVSGAVDPQLQWRRPEDAVTCSCHCAGPGPGPYCTCPSSMECVSLIPQMGTTPDAFAGSWCIPKGTAYRSNMVKDLCDSTTSSCGIPNPYP
jgi:hypothetical protein